MLAITGGKILTMVGPPIDRGTVLVDGDKIVQVGESINVPADGEIFDATGLIVMPGMIDCHTHVGIAEEIFREEGDDVNETTDPITPHLRAIDAINPMDPAFADAVAGGVTTVLTGPGSANAIGGEMVVMKTSGTVVDDMIVRHPAGLKAALGENPKRTYGKEKKSPVTRMAAAALIREALVQGLNYLGEKAPERDLKKESLARVLRREVPLRVHAHRADDIMTAVRIADEFALDLVIEHCTEGHLVAQKLAAKKVPAVVGPIITNRAKVEMKELTLAAARILDEAGVLLAIMTDHPVVPIQYLAASAALTVKGGLSPDKALQCITINAAKILGLEKRLGSTEPGKDADLVIWDGHPLDISARVTRVYIGGKRILP